MLMGGKDANPEIAKTRNAGSIRDELYYLMAVVGWSVIFIYICPKWCISWDGMNHASYRPAPVSVDQFPYCLPSGLDMRLKRSSLYLIGRVLEVPALWFRHLLGS